MSRDLLTNSVVFSGFESIRLVNSLNKRQFSDMIGVSVHTYSGYKEGKTPALDVIKRVSGVFGVSIDWIFAGGGDDVEPIAKSDGDVPRIEQLRYQLGFTKKQDFAKALGVSRQYYSTVANGMKISDKMLKVLKDKFDVDLDWLINGPQESAPVAAEAVVVPSFSGRLDEVRVALGYKVKAAFAKKLGVSSQSYGNYAQKATLPFEIIFKLVNMGVDAHWLLTGEGEMFVADQAMAEPDDKPKLAADEILNIMLDKDRRIAELEKKLKRLDDATNDDEPSVEETVRHFAKARKAKNPRGRKKRA